MLSLKKIFMNRSLNRLRLGVQCAARRGLLCILLAPLVLQGAEWEVSIQNHAFSPAQLEIDVGDTVIWTQRDFEGHTTASDTGVWSSPLLFVGQTFSHTFTEAGTFPYHCVPHPDMRGTIIVLPSVSGDVSITIVQPEPATVVTVPGSIRLEASVDAGEIEIIHVEFFNGDSPLGLVPASPYSLVVNLGEGEHAITAVATDSDGSSTTSEPVHVTVDRPEPASAPTPSISGDEIFTLSWSLGAGPFVLQRSTDLSDPDWETDAVVAAPTHTTRLGDPSGFFRIVDIAEHQGIPFTTSMSGAAERPEPINTEATGSGLFRLEGNVFTFNIWYENLSGPASAAHIHGPANAAEAAGIVIDLEPFNGAGFDIQGSLSGQVLLTHEQKAMLLAGRTYINVHTQAHPGGEIRGQVAPVLYQIRLSGDKERPNPVDSPGFGFGNLLLVGNDLVFHIDYFDLTEPASAAHIHGPAGVDAAAEVLVGLENHAPDGFGSSGTLSGRVSLSPEQLAWLIDGQTYINLHTPTHAPGEIRGQIVPQILGTPLTASLSGDAERPDPIVTDAHGTGIFRLEGELLTFNIRYESLGGPATAAHIHGPASADSAAGILIDLTPHNGDGFGISGILSGQIRISGEQRDTMLEGMTYVNVHTQAYPGGEIRGQIVPVLHHITLNGASERPDPVQSPGSGFGTLLLVGPDLTFHLDYKSLTGPATAAHIHGPASTDTSAGVLVDFESFAAGGFRSSGAFLGTTPLSPIDLARLIDQLTYINIHTQAHAPGEIRGQIQR
jgi:plastocyanin